MQSANDTTPLKPIFINGAAQWETLLPNTHSTRITLEMPFCIIEVLCGKMSTFLETQVVLTTICYVALILLLLLGSI